MAIVIYELTVEHFSGDFLSRRICKVRVKGFRQALNIYEPLGEIARWTILVFRNCSDSFPMTLCFKESSLDYRKGIAGILKQRILR